MTINAEKFRWASVLEVDPENGLDSKVEPPSEVKSSGEKRNQPIARQWLNWQLDQYYLAFKDLQQQINDLTASTSQPTLEAIYPVDSLYVSFNSTSPDTLLGFGTWERIKGKFLVGVDELDTPFDAPNKTGGTQTHSHGDNFSVDGHSLTVAELPADNPVDLNVTTAGSGATSAASTNPLAGDNETAIAADNNVIWSGNGDAHTHGLSGGVQSSGNLPPYQTIYMWKRTA